MGTAEARSAPRIRERSANPVRPPWTYRCRLPGRNVMIDVDAFNVGEAAKLAAGHWGVDRDDVDVEGQRRRWMRWIGISTHEAGDYVATDRSWWLWSKLGIGFALCFAVSWPIGTGIGEALREHRELSLEIQRAELERLRVENGAAAEQVVADDG